MYCAFVLYLAALSVESTSILGLHHVWLYQPIEAAWVVVNMLRLVLL